MMSTENEIEDLRRRLAVTEAKVDECTKATATVEKKAENYANWLKVLSVIAAALGIGALSLWQQANNLHNKYSVLNSQFAELERRTNALLLTLPEQANRVLTAAAPRVLEGNVQHFIRDDVEVFLRASNTGLFVTSVNGPKAPLYNGLMARGDDQGFRIYTKQTLMVP